MTEPSVYRDMTFERVQDAPVGTVYLSRLTNGYWFRILRGPCALCAYLGVPTAHPLANHEYDLLPVSVHGGLTYGAVGGEGRLLPAGWYWYGWDYSHAGDALLDRPFPSEKRWTPLEVENDSWGGRADFVQLMRLAEAIHKRAQDNHEPGAEKRADERRLEE